uniref:Uncharacterized protein n=1 Tax=Panagrolaimus davidi TaxID=227884 RepID=A0A914PM47_9BILA
MLQDIPKSPFSRGYYGEHSSLEEACKTPLNESDQFIAFRFQDDGYITMMSEDRYTLFHYPNCHGFNKTIVDHYTRPFQLLFEDPPYKSENMDEIVHKNSCRESYYDLMEYLKDFIKAYPDKLKFSISWAHNRQNALSSSDDYFYHFFKNSIKDFENSFLFIMGDHGLRYGKMRETSIGEAEDNNPALFLSVPKPLRNDLIFMQQLKTNSKELITHYDIYATLVEITNFFIPKPIIHGSSLFHSLPTPRTCDSLRIPFEYCICRSKKTLVKNDNEIGIKAAKMMVEKMNFELANSQKVAKICSQLSLIENGEIIVEDYGGEQSERVYKITFSTTPGNGKFWGIVTYDPSNQKIQILSQKFTRLNKYEFQARCAKNVKSDLASYCYCNSWF